MTTAVNDLEAMSLPELVKLRASWNDYEPQADEDLEWFHERTGAIEQEIAKRRAGFELEIRVDVTKGLAQPQIRAAINAELERRYPGIVRNFDCRDQGHVMEGDEAVYTFLIRELG